MRFVLRGLMPLLALAALWGAPNTARAGQALTLASPPSLSYETSKDGLEWSPTARDGAPSGGADNERALQGVRMHLSTAPLDGGVRYSAYVSGDGWQEWQANGEDATDLSTNASMEALRVELLGLAAHDYDVWYRALLPSGTWTGWAKDGEPAGSIGEGICVLQARILPKGTKAPGSIHGAFVDQELFDALNAAPAGTEVRAFGGATIGEKTLDALRKDVADVQARGVGVGFVMMDLESHAGVAYDCDRVFYAASSIKAPYMAAVAYLHPSALRKYERQMKETLEFSWDHTYKEIVADYGEAPLLAWMREADVEFPFAWFTKSNPWSPYTSRDMAKLWARIYQWFGQSATGETFGTWSENPETSAIHGELGDKYRTRSKAGWVTSEVRSWNATVDAGIVYADSPYVIVIMTDGAADFGNLTALTNHLDQAHDDLA